MSRYDEAREAYETERARVQSATACHSLPSPWDITGGFVLEDYIWELLKTPTKTEAAKIYEALLDYAEDAGWDCEGRLYRPNDH